MRWLIVLTVMCSLLTPLVTSAASATQPRIITSETDTRAYRFIELDNRLRVLLISDPTTDRAAAALDLHIGSSSNPRQWAGLAHFVEHMLFLGSEKYPRPDEYQEFIRAHGGSHNAYTALHHTNYHFSIPPAQFEPALARFARFFIDPLFTPELVARERAVVEAEYQARKKDEARRLWDARKTWVHADHPAARFAVGSLHTLRDRSEATARAQLMTFYARYYSANLMTLVVQSNHSLDQLQALARAEFSAIVDKKVARPRFTAPYLSPDLLPARLDVVPEKQHHSFRFVFPLPATKAEYRAKPLHVIANLLGHEGEGSLHARLKARGWADSLSAGVEYSDAVQSTFMVQVGLTEAGIDELPAIGEMLFETIDLLRARPIEQWRFAEQQQLAELAFRFAPAQPAEREVPALAARLHDYPPAEVLRGPYIIDQYRPQRVAELLSLLTPARVNVQVASPQVTGEQRTEFYDVDYRLTPLATALRQRWAAARATVESQLPPPNPFIPDRVTLLDVPSVPQPEVIVGPPARAGATPSRLTVWYQPDQEFATPRANLYINLLLPNANRSARHQVLTELYVRLVNAQLNTQHYAAYLAGLNYRLYRHARGISLKISGYEARQTELLAAIIAAMAEPQFTAAQFAVVCQARRRELANVALDAPGDYAAAEIYRLLLRPYWSEAERLAVLDAVQVQDLRDFWPQLFATARGVVLAHGDVTRATTRDRAGLVDAWLQSQGSTLATEIAPVQLRALQQERWLRTAALSHPDSALVLYFQAADTSVKTRATLRLLHGLWEADFYHQLRTLNQVGYLVHTGVVEIARTAGVLFSVQSATHSPLRIATLYDDFIAQFTTTMARMPPAQFATVQAGLLSELTRNDPNLSTRTARYWRAIDDEDYDFADRARLAAAVADLTPADLRDFLQTQIVPRTNTLTIQIPGQNGPATADPLTTPYRATGAVETFRATIDR